MVSHGVGIFDSTRNQFSVSAEFPKAAGWRHPAGQALKGTGADEGYWLFPAPELGLSPFPGVRVRGAVEEVERPGAYEAFTYLRAESEEVERDAAGRLVYGWKAKARPVGQKLERSLIAAGKLSEQEALTQVRDAETGALLEFHAGSVQWNEYRNKWIMIAEQLSSDSFSGEIWYAEADRPVGPWRTARRIATHGKQSFYNPVHHPFFDQFSGRVIYFEGSYGNTGGRGGDLTPGMTSISLCTGSICLTRASGLSRVFRAFPQRFVRRFRRFPQIKGRIIEGFCSLVCCAPRERGTRPGQRSYAAAASTLRPARPPSPRARRHPASSAGTTMRPELPAAR